MKDKSEKCREMAVRILRSLVENVSDLSVLLGYASPLAVTTTTTTTTSNNDNNCNSNNDKNNVSPSAATDKLLGAFCFQTKSEHKQQHRND